MTVRFFVPGKPVAKARARTVTRGKGGRALLFAKTFTPSKTVNYETQVAEHASVAMNGHELMRGPIELEVDMLMPIPSSWSEKRQLAAMHGEIRPTKKPDATNVLKSIEDACNCVVWRDDSQIVESRQRKLYSSRPGVRVTVNEAAGKPAP